MSVDERGGGEGRASRFSSYTEILEEACPQYMLMGLSYEDYWDGDPEKAVYVAKMYTLKLEAENRNAWNIGRYIYYDLRTLAPLMRDFAKVTKVDQYLEKPYPVTRAEEIKQAEEAELMQQRETQANLIAHINEINKRRREEREKTTDGT